MSAVATLALIAGLTAGIPFVAGSPPAGAATGTADLASLVNPFVGTGGMDDGVDQGGSGDTFPGADAPFGMVQWSPDTPVAPYGASYQAGSTTLNGFGLTNMSGAGCSIEGDVPVLPYVGSLGTSPSNLTATFSPATQSASPGAFGVTLRSGVKVQLAAATRAAIGTFTFPSTDQADLLLKLSGSEAGDSATSFHVLDDRTVVGSVTSGDFCAEPGNYTVYFAMQFDRPVTGAGTWTGSTLTPATPASGTVSNGTESNGTASGGTASSGTASSGAAPSTPLPNANGAYVTFDTSSDRTVKAKVAVSYVNTAGAVANVGTLGRSWDLGAVRSHTRSQWNDLLGRIAVHGGSLAERRTFYTALYHTMLFPSTFSDVTGDYRGFDDRVHRVARGHVQYANFSGWDIYRTEVPLLAMVDPHVVDDWVRSMLAEYEQIGSLPRWSLANVETHVMVGDPSDPIIADAYAFGARGFPFGQALAAMVHDATTVNADRPTSGDQTSTGYIGFGASMGGGCCNTETSQEPVSAQLEDDTADMSIAALAQALGAHATAQHFSAVAQNWEALFNPSNKFLEPRHTNGEWLDGWSPITTITYTEGDGYIYTGDVPFNLAGLITKEGGDQAWAGYLDGLFSNIASPTLSNAQMNDEPSFELPWEYDYVGEPWRTQAVVRQIETDLFDDQSTGLPGNDDLGAMSAWYVWAALGMYPETPGTPVLALGSPLFPSATIHMGDGHVVHITAPAAAADHPYVHGLTLDGRNVDRPYLSYEQLASAGSVRFTLAASPDRTWGTAAVDAPPSYAGTDPPSASCLCH